MPADRAIPLDALVFGGGASGLWLLDELRRAGHAAMLVERSALGSGQTVASQGIIHGGLKYTLSGLLNPAARAVRDMPDLWRACLRGTREPDLSETRVRADSCLLWQTSTFASKVGMIGATRGLAVRPEKLDPAERPGLLKHCPGTVARLPEQVIDPASFLANLARRNAARLLRAGDDEIDLGRDGDTIRVTLRPPGRPPIVLQPRRVVLAAGAGNESLRARLDLPPDAMQRRPLHMVLVRGRPEDLPALNGHCIDGRVTRVTVTADRDSAGRTIWQVGGQLAESGVARDRAAQIAHARAELAAALPALDLRPLEFATHRVDRAETATDTGVRPDTVQVRDEGGVITVWPTKLALVPRAAEAVLARLPEPREPVPPGDLPDAFPRPDVAPPPWETETSWTSDPSAAPA